MPDDSNSKLVTLTTFNDNIQAGFVREQLKAHGIAAFIPDEHTAQMAGVPSVFGGIRLQVFEADEEEARRVLDARSDPGAERAIEMENQVEWDQPESAAVGEPVCPACSSDLVYLADYRAGQILLSFLLLGIPLLFIQRDLVCKSCGHRWNQASGLHA